MKLIDLKLLEGRNIKGEERLIYINIGEAERKKLYWLISDYEFICRQMNIEGTRRDVIYDEYGGKAWLTYLHKELALFIIENLIDGVNADDLLKEAVSKRGELWEYNLLHECSKKDIDFFVDEDSVVIGYGVNSKRINQKEFESRDYDFTLKEDGRIPIISITGTNGKTSTSRLIYKALNNIGYYTGLASTGSIIINDEVIKKGDTTGFYSAKTVLTNPKVEMAVLETARGGILRKGLGFKGSKVAIITSLSEDHIGAEGINSLDDLMDIKLVTTREVRDDGKVIIKADHKLYKILQTKHNLVLFNNEKNECIKRHIKNGKEAWYVENGNVIFFDGECEKVILNICDFKFTHEGKSKTNINNILSALAALFTVHPKLEEVINSLKDIECDINSNLGRQNVLDINEFKVILDYGHNPEAFEEVFLLANSLKENKIISIISSPGDRLDDYIKKLGEIAGKSSDIIFIKETFDRRGRNPLEITNLLTEGIKESANKDVDIFPILDEKEAVEKALAIAEKGDIIVDFTQHLEVVIPVINEYLDKTKGKLIELNLDSLH